MEESPLCRAENTEHEGGTAAAARVQPPPAPTIIPGSSVIRATGHVLSAKERPADKLLLLPLLLGSL
ncbi:unnamed protein product [Lampetra planeri]